MCPRPYKGYDDVFYARTTKQNVDHADRVAAEHGESKSDYATTLINLDRKYGYVVHHWKKHPKKAKK